MMFKKKADTTIQYDSSKNKFGEQNVTEAVETQGDIYFNESYIVIGECLKAKDIYATYNLTIVGNVNAEKISVNGDLVVDGDIKAEEIRCLKGIVCTGKILADRIICDEDLVGSSIDVLNLETQGNALVTNSIDIEEGCTVKRNIIAGVGISGSGSMNIESAIANDYFDFDGDIQGNVYEIATMFERSYEHKDSSKSDDDNEDNGRQSLSYKEQLESLLKDFEAVYSEDEETIVEELNNCASIQKVSFSQISYLFNEIIRISYLDKIENLRDYLYVVYAENIFNEALLNYETIDHVFKLYKKSAKVDELPYSADNLVEFVMSLDIVSKYFKDDLDSMADKIFSYVGIKYTVVNRSFEGAN